MYEPDRACVIQVEKVVKMPTFYAEDTAASANEVWSRLHSDPLFAVRALGPNCLPIKLASQKDGCHRCPALFALLVLPVSILATVQRCMRYLVSQVAEPLRRICAADQAAGDCGAAEHCI